MVENFGIKYRNVKDTFHIIAELREKYEVTQDWMGGLYCGIKLKWEYAERLLKISMPVYLKRCNTQVPTHHTKLTNALYLSIYTTQLWSHRDPNGTPN